MPSPNINYIKINILLKELVISNNRIIPNKIVKLQPMPISYRNSNLQKRKFPVKYATILLLSHAMMSTSNRNIRHVINLLLHQHIQNNSLMKHFCPAKYAKGFLLHLRMKSILSNTIKDLIWTSKEISSRLIKVLLSAINAISRSSFRNIRSTWTNTNKNRREIGKKNKYNNSCNNKNK